MAMSVVAGISQFQQQRQEADDAEAEANYRAQVDQQNAKRAEYMAQDALARGAEDERKERIRGRLLQGEMVAALAQNGMDPYSGSGLEMFVDQAGTNEQNSLDVRNSAQREAQDYRIRANQFTSNAALTKIAGENTAKKKRYQATGSLLSTAGEVATKWNSYKTAGT